MLVETSQIGSVIKRLFSGEMSEIIGEILQNAQRAGATRLEVLSDTASGTLIITDNGSGLVQDAGTVEQFLPLMTVALSSYERREVAAQAPMGVGLFSLLAHREVREIEVASKNLALTLPTREVWENDAFWNNWQRCVAPSDFAGGFRIIVKASEGFAEHFANHLRGVSTPGSGDLPYFYSPARGYRDLLEIYVDGEAVDTSNPKNAEKFDLEIADTEYEGNRLKIGFVDFTEPSTVNWFGQIINLGRKELSSHFRICLEVRQGTPVTPQSPTRSGLVKDEKLEKLREFIQAEVRKFVLNEQNREKISTGLLRKLASEDREWFLAECPYYAAREIIYTDAPQSSEEFEAGCEQVLNYADDHLLLENKVLVGAQENDGEFFEAWAGLSTFIPQIGRAFSVSVGNRSKLRVQQLWWRYGQTLPDESGVCFVEKGEFGLTVVSDQADAEKGDVPPAQWTPLNCENNVFVYDGADNWSVREIDGLVVGTGGSLKEKIEFLETEAWAGWSYEHDNASWDDLEQSFRQSLEEAKTGLFSNAVEKSCFDFYKFRNQCGIDFQTKIAAIRFIEKDGADYGVEIETAGGQIIEKVWLDNLLQTV